MDATGFRLRQPLQGVGHPEVAPASSKDFTRNRGQLQLLVGRLAAPCHPEVAPTDGKNLPEVSTTTFDRITYIWPIFGLSHTGLVLGLTRGSLPLYFDRLLGCLLRANSQGRMMMGAQGLCCLGSAISGQVSVTSGRDWDDSAASQCQVVRFPVLLQTSGYTKYGFSAPRDCSGFWEPLQGRISGATRNRLCSLSQLVSSSLNKDRIKSGLKWAFGPTRREKIGGQISGCHFRAGLWEPLGDCQLGFPPLLWNPGAMNLGSRPHENGQVFWEPLQGGVEIPVGAYFWPIGVSNSFTETGPLAYWVSNSFTEAGLSAPRQVKIWPRLLRDAGPP